jgi:hypothetical protein
MAQATELLLSKCDALNTRFPTNQVWQLMPIISALERLQQEVLQFKTSLGYLGDPVSRIKSCLLFL